jgi:hypothetical protein
MLGLTGRVDGYLKRGVGRGRGRTERKGVENSQINFIYIYIYIYIYLVGKRKLKIHRETLLHWLQFSTSQSSCGYFFSFFFFLRMPQYSSQMAAIAKNMGKNGQISKLALYSLGCCQISH